MINNLTGELTDPSMENAFLDSTWPRSRLFCRTLFGATALIILALVMVNFRDPQITTEMLATMTPSRIVQITVYCYMFFISFLRRRPTYFNWAMVGAQLATLAAEYFNDVVTLLPLLKGETPPLPFLMIVLFVYYTLLPSRFVYTIIYGLVATIIYTLAASLYFSNVYYLLLEFIFVNLIGISYGRFVNRLQRQDYINRMELERAETEAVEARRVAEQASADKSRFIAVASHDLRQPLHAMGLWIDTLNQQARAHADAPLAETVGHLTRAKDSLDGLLDRLLHASHLDSGTTEIRPEPVSLTQLLQDIATRFMEPAKQRDITLRLSIGNQTLYTDPVLLARILDNLLDNAIKYAFPGGSVLLGTRRRGDSIAIQVWNQGEQIPPVQIGQIFDEFHQVPREDGQAFRGLGLGLSIVKRLCELLDHPVTVNSHANGWTVFEVEVPIQSIEPVPVMAPTDYRSPHESLDLRILVIDDNPEILAAMDQLLTRWQAEVMLAGSQAQAIEACERARPDLIISDQHLGGGESGIDVVDLLLKRLGDDIPVILMSGETSAQSLKAADSTGFPLFTKPVKPARLRMAILQAGR